MSGAVSAPRVALLYAADAYMESVPRGVARNATAEQPGLLGRRVAGKEFLDAYLRFGSWSELVALVVDQGAGELLAQHWRGLGARSVAGRSLRIVRQGEFHRSFFPDPVATVLHMPCPPESRFAWA